jgi:hypothetical protein
MLLGRVFSRMGAKSGAIVALLIGLTGCTTVGQFSGAASGRITIPVTYQDSSGNTLAVEDRPAGATVWLGAMPGAIFGGARDRLKTEPVTSAPAFELDLRELRDIAEKQSATLTPAASASGWKIAPADTRLIRVATNLNYEAPHRQLPMTKFVDLQSDRLLMLVYFDRPCQLTGAIAERAGSHDEVDVTVGEAGLHWLEATGGASELTHVVRHASGTITPILVANLPAK